MTPSLFRRPDQPWRDRALEVAREVDHEDEVGASFDRLIARGFEEREAAPLALAEWGIYVPEEGE